MVTFIIIVMLIAAVVGLYLAVALAVFVGKSYLWGYDRQRKKLCQELHAASQFPWPDDATKCQRAIDSFLWKAKKAVTTPSDEADYWHAPDDRSADINFFIRMCHALGCEIVIRRVAAHDIEADPNNTTLIQARDSVETNR